jgi:hypothetical protein
VPGQLPAKPRAWGSGVHLRHKGTHIHRNFEVASGCRCLVTQRGEVWCVGCNSKLRIIATCQIGGGEGCNLPVDSLAKQGGQAQGGARSGEVMGVLFEAKRRVSTLAYLARYH